MRGSDERLPARKEATAGERLRRALCISQWVAAVVPLGYLVARGVAASSTRWWADDWCFAATVRHDGFAASMVSWYRAWTGRFTATAATSALTSVPPAVAGWILLVMVLAWVAALAWTLGQMPWVRRTTTPAVRVALAGMVVLATVALAPGRAQDVDWITGACAYLLPMVLATPVVGLAFRAAAGQRTGWSVALSGGLAFLAAGCSETLTGMELAALVLAGAASIVWPAVRRARWVVGASAAGAVLGGLVVALAPGNGQRVAALGTHGSVGNLFLPTLRYAVIVLRDLAGSAPLVLVVALAAGAVVALATPSPPAVRRPARVIAASLVAVVTLAAGATAPALYYSFGPAPRSQIGEAASLVLLAAGVGLVLGAMARRAPSRTTAWLALPVAAVLLLVAVPPQAAPLDSFSRASQLAQAWDRRDARIRAAVAAGARTVTVPRLTSGPLLADLDSPDVNSCAQEYYGIGIVVR